MTKTRTSHATASLSLFQSLLRLPAHKDAHALSLTFYLSVWVRRLSPQRHSSSTMTELCQLRADPSPINLTRSLFSTFACVCVDAR